MTTARLFALTAFAGAWLLFMVQPMLGRFILPWFGGGAAVWSACMLFFQAALLGGYGYAHLVAPKLPLRRSIGVHLGLAAVSLALLPITPDGGWKPASGDLPTLRIVGLLLVSVGGPYLVLASTAPLLQAWAARIQPRRSPYRLYAWSNTGSLLALLAYPIGVEPWVGLVHQTWVWSASYLVFVGLLAACARATWRREHFDVARVPDEEPVEGQGRGGFGTWTVLSATGSLLLLAITETLSADVSASPFLWVVPLALYLATFIICFGRPSWARRSIWVPAMFLAIGALWWAIEAGAEPDLWMQIVLYNAALFACCMAVHGELVHHRPPASRLTTFYVAMSVGGAIGGAAVAVAAPLVFDFSLELPIGMVLAPTLVLGSMWWERRTVVLRAEPAWIWLFPILVVVGLAAGLTTHLRDDLDEVEAISRGFYGVLRVEVAHTDDPQHAARRLVHGRIAHGRQYMHRDRTREPIGYYGEDSGIGLALRWRPPGPTDGRRVGVIGLGVGTIAAYGEPGDVITFYEIDPDVARFARESFTYIEESDADVEIELGDARLTLERALPGTYDLIVLDAFSSDAIPNHLLTREAFALYFSRLRPYGTLVVNIANRHLDLRPVVLAHAEPDGWSTVEVRSDGDLSKGLYYTRWLLVTRDENLLAWPELHDHIEKHRARLRETPRVLWTDDYTPILDLLKG